MGAAAGERPGGADTDPDGGAAVPRAALGAAPSPSAARPAAARRCLAMAPAAPSMLRLTCVVMLLGRAAPAAGKGPPVCAVIAAGERFLGSG